MVTPYRLWGADKGPYVTTEDFYPENSPPPNYKVIIQNMLENTLQIVRQMWLMHSTPHVMLFADKPGMESEEFCWSLCQWKSCTVAIISTQFMQTVLHHSISVVQLLKS